MFFVMHNMVSEREAAVKVTIDDFMTCLYNKFLIHAIFLDFKKPFDKVSHKKLCDKLATYGIHGKLCDFLSNSMGVGWRQN